MPFEPKKWVSEENPLGPPADPEKATPLSGAALVDLEERLAAYAETQPGPEGPEGPAGAAGATWYSGAGAPEAGLGVNGDFYLRTSNDEVYKKAAGAWTELLNLKGATGETGPEGKPLSYDVLFDAASQSAAGTGTLEWKHLPVAASPSGVVVLVAQDGTAADQVTAVTYGVIPMLEVPNSPFLGAKVAGVIHAFWLGSDNVPSGEQTVKVTVSGANPKRAVAYTVNSSSPTLTVQAGYGLAGEVTTKPQLLNGSGPAIRTASDAVIVGGLLLGDAAVSEFKLNPEAEETLDFTHDFGSQVAGWGHQTAAQARTSNIPWVRWESLGPTGVGYAHFSVIIRPVRNIGRVTSLPTAVALNDTCVYVADGANGVFWDLIYDGEGEYPWKKIGGEPLIEEKEAGIMNGVATSYTSLGCEVKTPLKGDYLVTINAQIATSSPGITGLLSYKIGATAAVDADSVSYAGGWGAFQPRTKKKTALAASTALLLHYRVTSGNGNFNLLYIAIDPIRVG